MEIVANIGHNWLSMDGDSKGRMITLVEAAHKAGVESMCFKLFKADEVYREDKDIDATTMYDTQDEVVTAGVNHAKRMGLRVYITPQYLDAVTWSARVLKPYGYHIADGDFRFGELVKNIGEQNKPTLISSGLYEYGEMEHALEEFFDKEKVTLLFSTAGMPTPPKDANLPGILSLAAHFWKMEIMKYGLDSTYISIGLDTVAMGYRLDVLMRTLDLEDGEGVESNWSITPTALASLVELDQIVSLATSPTYKFGNLTQAAIVARDKLLRGTDALLPCNCGEGNTDT